MNIGVRMNLNASNVFSDPKITSEMIDIIPLNVMYCDLDLTLIYLNKKSIETLKKLEHLLPDKVENLIGISIDRFHRNPAHQRKLLSNDKNLPLETNIVLGEHYLNLNVNAIYNEGRYSGVMVTWAIVTDKLHLDFLQNSLNKSQAIIEFNVDGTVIKANDNFCDALEYKQSELIGKHHSLFCDEKYVKTSAYKEFWQKLNDGLYDAGQYPRVSKSGQTVWIQATYNPVLDNQGKVFKVVKYATNITAQKKEWFNLLNILSNTSGQLAAAAEELTATSNQLHYNATKTNEQSLSASAATEEVDSGVRSVATNMEEMTASIKEITRTTNEASSMTNETLRKAQHTNKVIEQLGVSSRDIGNVIKVISSIAQQTNLLALNATIEAARAGDAGRGFAVVANEVKELAKQTAKATSEITKKIETIQNDTKNAVSAIGEISISIDKINGHTNNVAAAVEEQAATTNEISRIIVESSSAIGGVSSLVRDVSVIAGTNSTDATQLIEASRGLHKLASELRELVTKLN